MSKERNKFNELRPLFTAALDGCTNTLCLALRSLIVNKKQQYATLCLRPLSPFILKIETEDLSVEGMLKIPADWFTSYEVSEPLQLSIDLQAFHTSLQARLGSQRHDGAKKRSNVQGNLENKVFSVRFFYPDSFRGAFCVQLEPVVTHNPAIEAFLYVRHQLTDPLNLGFTESPIVAQFECESSIIREIMTNFLTFGCSQISIRLSSSQKVASFEGSGCPWGTVIVNVGVGDGNMLTFYNVDTVYHKYLLVHAMFTLGGSAAWGVSSDNETSKAVLRWNTKGIISATYQWCHSPDCTKATTEICMLPAF